jgi:hypothetical protein
MDKDQIPTSSRNTTQYPILRELRRELLLEITNGEQRIGTSKEINSWILDQYQSNHIVGDMYRGILLINEDLLLKENELPSLSKCKTSITSTEKHPLPEFGFVSSLLQGRPTGALVQREELQGSGLVYSITLFDRKNLTKKASRIEIRASKNTPNPFASILTINGWARFTQDEIHSTPHIVFALQCLIALHNYKYPILSINSIVDYNVEKQRHNEHLKDLITKAYSKKVNCHKVKASLDKITPRDIDYALSIPEADIKSFIEQIREYGYPFHDLLLYEKNGNLVMDDDYTPYLAYRALKLKEVPAVIVGDFLHSNATILETGSGELMPPIIVSQINTRQKNIKSKEVLLQEKLSHLTSTVGIEEKLSNRFMHFCRILSNTTISEKELHDFLCDNPHILDSHAALVFSEVNIGRYRADLILCYEQVDKRIVLIELEKNSDKIFTKANRLRQKVTHASQQVEDWIKEIRNGTNKIPSWLNREFCPEGAVVIGRTRDLTEEQKQTLATINKNRLVKIITYDDLLTRMKQLIKSLQISE